VPTSQPSTLTRREQEVATLVAQGLTNRQIAQHLFISERTAEHHVEQIRSKLGFHSRAQIAAWIAGQPASEGTPPAPPKVTSQASAPSPKQAAGARPARRLRWPIVAAAGGLAAGLLAVLVFLATQPGEPAMTITTVAGTGRSTFSPDGSVATATDLTRPLALAVDAGGSLYFIDGNRVRMITGQGRITTIAGTGDRGDRGDGGSARVAHLNSPQALAIDPDGNVFIADTGNNRVRKVSASGDISTVAGTGDAGYFGDGGQAVKARLNSPAGLALGFGGALFIADTMNHRVRQVAANGVITTVAGTGTAGYSFEGVPALAAPLNLPEALAFDSEGHLYVADVGNRRVREIDLSGAIRTVAGTGRQGFSGDRGPGSAAKVNLATEGYGGGNLYVADTGNQRIRKVDLRGNISSVAGTGRIGYSGDGGPPSAAILSLPLSVAVDVQGTLYLADSGNNRIRKIARGR